MAASVLLVLDGVHHPSLLGRFWLRRGLAAMPGYRCRRVGSLEALPGLRPGSLVRPAEPRSLRRHGGRGARAAGMDPPSWPGQGVLLCPGPYGGYDAPSLRARDSAARPGVGLWRPTCSGGTP
jgi:hypothetical protein